MSKKIKFQDKNLNKGTDKGREMVQKSVDKFGMRDAIIVDKFGEIISGNHRKKAADQKGISKERIIKANSDEVIAIQYDDIDLSTKEGKELALALNQSAKFNISIDEVEAYEEIGDEVNEWGIEIEENGEDLNFSSAGSSLKYLSWGSKKVLVTDQEIDGLNQILEEYSQKFSISAGFSNFITDATRDKFKQA
jgi:high-affinity K+ transport system ATPase subunit B